MGIPNRVPLADCTTISPNVSGLLVIESNSSHPHIPLHHKEWLSSAHPDPINPGDPDTSLPGSSVALNPHPSPPGYFLSYNGIGRTFPRPHLVTQTTSSPVPTSVDHLEPEQTHYISACHAQDDQGPLESISIKNGDDTVDRQLTSSIHNNKEVEIHMILQYISDWQNGRYDGWPITCTQGLRSTARNGSRFLDDVPSKSRATKVPLNYLLRKIQFASAVNRACEAAGSDDSPFPDCRFIFRSEGTISHGVQRVDKGSLTTLRLLHEHVFHSRLLPLHPCY